MNKEHITKIAKELKLKEKQVLTTAQLLEEDATIPFIARYRKEVTGSLDEVTITVIRDRLNQLKDLDKRREAILKSLEERELLTDELKVKIMAAETMSVLEDIYLPFKPKRRTRATIAKEKGLEPLAELLFEQGDINPIEEAKKYIDREKGIITWRIPKSGIGDPQPGDTLTKLCVFTAQRFGGSLIPFGPFFRDLCDTTDPRESKDYIIQY